MGETGPAASDIEARYSKRYSDQSLGHLYPVEFVVRAFLGTYPDLKLDKADYSGRCILDLGYGDGRNMPLLKNLQFRIYGVEIHDSINQAASERLERLGIKAELKVGSNTAIPFADGFFDYLLACHSCYYVREGTMFGDNLKEIHRVLRKGGVFICSLPMRDTYVLEGAERLPGGHWRVMNDPYGLREGTIFRAFENQKEIETELDPLFSDLKIGFCDDYYWGIRQKVWVIVGKRR